ncbi:MAG: hypothetical protein R2754_06865 [Microthrixaceae bacterium]
MIVEVSGLGVIGRRLHTELLASNDVELVRLRTRRPDAVSAQLGGAPRTEVVGADEPVRADWAALTVEAAAHRDALARYRSARVPVVSCCDDAAVIDGLLGGVGTPVVVGAAFSPGLTDVMASHTLTLLDEVDELHVARHGAAGSACVAARARAIRQPARDWRDGEWVERPPGSGRELCFFPEPVRGLDAYRANLSEVATLHAAHPGVARLSNRITMRRRERLPAAVGLPAVPAPNNPASLGAAVVEARGRVGAGSESVLLGVVDRVDGATAALMASCGNQLVARGDQLTGTLTAGQVAPSVVMLAALAERGVSVARFGPQ